MAAAAQGPPRPGEDECRAALRDIWRSRPQVSAPILLRRELERHLGLPQRSLDVQWVAQLSQAERAAREEQRRAERGGRRRAADGGRDLRAPRPKAARRARPPACGAERGWRELWDTRRFADAAVECGGRRLEVHRAVLAARSPVLMAMFGQEGMREGLAREVVIPNSCPGIVEAMLMYMYVGEIGEGVDCAGLLQLADQYQVAGLPEACAEVLLEELAPETVASTLVTLRDCRHSSPRLEAAYEQVLKCVRRDKALVRAVAEHVDA